MYSLYLSLSSGSPENFFKPLIVHSKNLAVVDGRGVVHYCTLSLFDIWVTRQSAEWEPPISTGTL